MVVFGSMSYTEEDTAGRPKLSLQPRGSASDISSSSPAKSSRVSFVVLLCVDLELGKWHDVCNGLSIDSRRCLRCIVLGSECGIEGSS